MQRRYHPKEDENANLLDLRARLDDASAIHVIPLISERVHRQVVGGHLQVHQLQHFPPPFANLRLTIYT